MNRGSSHYLKCEGREIHYMLWGAEHAATVVAWHGLARTGRDMDDIAAGFRKVKEHLAELRN